MKKPIICFIFSLFLVFMIFPNASLGSVFAKSNTIKIDEELKINAKAGLLIDYDTGTVIFEKNANERLPIASMTKLATLAVVFDSIEKGAIKESDYVTVSKTASRVGGSSAFLDSTSSYKISELIKSVIIASANDSSVALAEHIAGSEDVFVNKMNKFVKEQNLENTNFKNCTGLPVDGHYSSAYDMAKIYKHVCNNELYKKYSKIWMDDFIHPSGRKTGLVNTNKLIKTYEGVEGGKTGFTNAARFCLTASACRGNLRLIGVVIGANDSKTRFSEMRKLFDYGFANFDSKLVASKDIPLTVAEVKKTDKKIEVCPNQNVTVFYNKNENKQFSVDFKLNDINAPVVAGDVVGKMFVFDENNMVVEEVDLVSKNTVNKLNLKERLRKIVNVW